MTVRHRRGARWCRLPLALGASLVLAAAACSPAPSAISDPREILDLAVAHLRAARTAHLDVAVEGDLAIGSLLGMPGSGGSVGLAGTHLAVDFDIAGGRAAAQFEVPALLGLRGELRQIGEEAYLSSSLTDRGWHRVDAGTLPLGAARPLAWLDAIAAWLDRPDTVPTRLADASCPAGTCYVVRAVVSGAELGAVASAAPEVVAALAEATLTVEARVDRGALRLSQATIDIDLGPGGTITLTVTFTAWDASVSIEPPPASEIVEGPLLP
jgi:hypothetical protein